MRRSLARVTFPLLRKELLEQAARRRTYLVRVIYALLLFGAFCWFYAVVGTLANYHQRAMLGIGRHTFEFLVTLQFCGIYLFLPAMMSRVITQEKERDSLGLLLLTNLSPSEILLEKYLGRLLPMLTFMLLGLPLLAVSYSLGGLSLSYLLSGLWLLGVTCFQVGAIALMWSAWSRTSTGALLATYAFGLLFYAAPILIIRVTGTVFFDSSGSFHLPDACLFAHIPPALFYEMARRTPLLEVVLWSLQGIVPGLVFLLLARLVLLRRAFLRPSSRLLQLFGSLDRVMRWANQFVGGYVLVHPADSLPHDRPVAWREVNKKALGQTRYLIRLLVLLQLPTMFFLFVALHAPSGDKILGTMICALWILTALALAASGANTIAEERSNQTLDVLLTTPLTSREIILQKIQAIKRLGALCCVPLASAILTKTWWLGSQNQLVHDSWVPGTHAGYGWLAYLLSASINLATLLPLICWLSVWIGLKIKGRSQAVILALGALLAWSIVPIFVVLLANVLLDLREHVYYLAVFSPALHVFLTEAGAFTADAGPILVALLWHGALAYKLRAHCLDQADRLLDRAAAPQPSRLWVACVLLALILAVLLCLI